MGCRDEERISSMVMRRGLWGSGRKRGGKVEKERVGKKIRGGGSGSGRLKNREKIR